ncbi:MAG: hypothetical protein K0R73_1024 [Candidatus Midichloriaceae bacterium]|jgi:hypothetical protein|nr:hypothetical protein [Candidatus Midichloriaceae bacterium]
MISKEQAEQLLVKYEVSLKELRRKLSVGESKLVDANFVTKVLNALQVVAERPESDILTSHNQDMSCAQYEGVLLNLYDSSTDDYKQFNNIINTRLVRTKMRILGGGDGPLIDNLDNFLKELSKFDLSLDKNPFKAELDPSQEEAPERVKIVFAQKSNSGAAATWKFAMGFVTGCVAFCEIHPHIPKYTRSLMVNNPYMHLTSALGFPLVAGGLGYSRYGWIGSATCSAWGIYSSMECKEIKNFVNIGVGVIGLLVNYCCRGSAFIEKA